MRTYTKEQILIASELGEISMIDANHICSLLDDAVEEEKRRNELKLPIEQQQCTHESYYIQKHGSTEYCSHCGKEWG
jgi:hypothetical protein